jgi:hypothetical protein
VVQNQILLILSLLLFFNEPFYFEYVMKPIPIMSYFNSFVQASLLASILYFWLYILETMLQQEMVSEPTFKFYLPKVVISGLLWACSLPSMAIMRDREAEDPTFYENSEISTSRLGTLAFIGSMFVLMYVVVLLPSIYKFVTVQRLQEGHKFFIVTTYAVIVIILGCLIITGMHGFVSTSCSITRILAI